VSTENTGRPTDDQLVAARVQLAATEEEALRAFLQSRWGHRNCPACKTAEMSIMGVSYVRLGVPAQAMGRSITDEVTLPTAALLCPYCGNAVFISLKVAGLR
jgi:hypothetical protein